MKAVICIVAILASGALHADEASDAYEQAKRAYLKGDLAIASGVVNRALKLNPDSGPAHRLRGSILVSLERLGDALKEYEIALRLNPKDADSHFNVGRVLSLQGKFADAEAAYTRALDLGPDALALAARGWCRHELGRDDEARADLAKSLSIDPKNLQAQINLGAINVKSGQYSEALPPLTAVLKAQPDNVAALELRALTYEKLNKPREAKRDRDRIRTVKPTMEMMGIRPGLCCIAL